MTQHDHARHAAGSPWGWADQAFTAIPMKRRGRVGGCTVLSPSVEYTVFGAQINGQGSSQAGSGRCMQAGRQKCAFTL